MSGINLLLAFIALLGFLPLAIILFKKRRAKTILSVGLQAKATVYDVRPIPRSAAEGVAYKFFAQNSSQQYTGSFTIKYGSYKPGDTLDIYYLPSNPRRNTVNGAWASPFILVFGVIIGVVILFMVYKMYEMV